MTLFIYLFIGFHRKMRKYHMPLPETQQHYYYYLVTSSVVQKFLILIFDFGESIEMQRLRHFSKQQPCNFYRDFENFFAATVPNHMAIYHFLSPHTYLIRIIWLCKMLPNNFWQSTQTHKHTQHTHKYKYIPKQLMRQTKLYKKLFVLLTCLQYVEQIKTWFMSLFDLWIISHFLKCKWWRMTY